MARAARPLFIFLTVVTAVACAAVTGLGDYEVIDDAVDAGGADSSRVDNVVPSAPEAAAADATATETASDAAIVDATVVIDATCPTEIDGSLDHCGACFAACPARTVECRGGTCVATLRIRVGIDGDSTFILSRAEAYWHNVLYAAPGRHGSTPLPLELNGQKFYPTWPDVPDAANYSCGCDSSKFTIPSAPLAAKAQAVALQIVAARGQIQITEQPSAANDYHLSVRFYDVGIGNSDYYEALLTYESR